MKILWKLTQALSLIFACPLVAGWSIGNAPHRNALRTLRRETRIPPFSNSVRINNHGLSHLFKIRMVGAESADVANLASLGTDSLLFLAATVALVPLSKKLQISPVLGFLIAGLVLGPNGLMLIRDLRDLNALGELGITFLLFEQGLELSLDRLKALGKYAFGLGILQVLLCTAVFGAFPFIGGVQFLELVFKSPDVLVNIQRLDEAVVIGAALSLSSSAFVLKILKEKGLLQGRAGQASLGVLLLQDIAVVPLLVLLPIIENQEKTVDFGVQATFLALTFLKAIGGLGAILVFGRVLLRRLFEAVATARSTETFVALCLLVAIGIGELTDLLGLSTTLGAFIAGTLLAETNYRMQVEADIAPFRGLLLGLFFMTTGASVDPYLLLEQWPTVLGLLLGLLLIKGLITSCLCPLFGLTKGESVRVGSILSGGGEFAFVVLTLAQKLNVLPMSLDKLLVGVVVLSMGLTPIIAEAGERLGQYFDGRSGDGGVDEEAKNPEGLEDRDLVVICGFGPVGQIVASFISSSAISASFNGVDFVAFDLDPKRVSECRAMGYPVFYGDGSQPMVIETAGILNPKALVITYSNHEMARIAVERLRAAYPLTPIFTRATDYEQYWRLKDEGATAVVSDLSEISIRLGSEVLESFGIARSYEIESAKKELRQTLATLSQAGGIKREFSRKFSADQLAPMQFISSDVSPSKITKGAILQLTDDGSLNFMGVLEEDLGVTVCLLPEWEDSEDGQNKFKNMESIDQSEGTFLLEINDDIPNLQK